MQSSNATIPAVSELRFNYGLERILYDHEGGPGIDSQTDWNFANPGSLSPADIQALSELEHKLLPVSSSINVFILNELQSWPKKHPTLRTSLYQSALNDALEGIDTRGLNKEAGQTLREALQLLDLLTQYRNVLHQG